MNKLIDLNIEIVEFDESYTQQVIDLILDIQNNEYLIGIDLQAQKDLTKIIEFYEKTNAFEVNVIDCYMPFDHVIEVKNICFSQTSTKATSE